MSGPRRERSYRAWCLAHRVIGPSAARKGTPRAARIGPWARAESSPRLQRPARGRVRKSPPASFEAYFYRGGLILQPTSAPSPMASFPLRRKDVEDFNRLLGDTPGYYAKMLGVPVVMANKCGPFTTKLPAFFPAQKSVFPGLSAIVDGDGGIKG